MASLIIKEAVQILPAKHATRARQLSKYFENSDKCTASLSENFFTTDTAENESLEMACLCDSVDKTGTAKLIQHWVLNWRLDNNEPKPSHEIMFKAASEAMESIGFGTCPRRMSIHENTEHPHVHIAIARVDPYAGTIIKDSFTHMKAQKATAEIANRYGWETAPGNLYKCDQNGEITFNKDRPTKRGGIRSKALEKEKITGFKSQERLLNETLKIFCDENRQYFKAWKWGDLHKALALIGVEMEYTKHTESGGLAFSLDGKTWEKASIACPELAYPEIKKALGAKGEYRKARADIKEILAEIRSKKDNTPQPLTGKDLKNGTTIHYEQPEQNQSANSRNETELKTGTSERNNAGIEPDNTKGSSQLHTKQHDQEHRSTNQKNALQSGQIGNPETIKRTGLEASSIPRNDNEISTRNPELHDSHRQHNAEPNDRGNTTAQRNLERTERTDQPSIIWNFEPQQENNGNNNTARETRLYFERRSQENRHQTSILMEKIKAITKQILLKIARLAEHENLKMIHKINHEFTIKQQFNQKTIDTIQKFDHIKKTMQNLQTFYDKKFLQEYTIEHTTQEQSQIQNFYIQ